MVSAHQLPHEVVGFGPHNLSMTANRFPIRRRILQHQHSAYPALSSPHRIDRTYNLTSAEYTAQQTVSDTWRPSGALRANWCAPSGVN